jgi:hypothetical protein
LTGAASVLDKVKIALLSFDLIPPFKSALPTVQQHLGLARMDSFFLSLNSL